MDQFRFPTKKHAKIESNDFDRNWLENRYTFLKKHFHKMSRKEKEQLKKDAHGNDTFYFDYILKHPDRFPLKEVCKFLKLHKEDESLYVCFEHTLDNRDKDEKDQSTLLEPIKYFVEERCVDLNRPFINKREKFDKDEPKLVYEKYPLQLALYWRMPEYVIKYLLDKGAKPENCHENCLNAGYFALDRNMIHLFDHKILFDSTLPHYVNPLSYCCYWDIAHVEGAKWCIEHGYNPNVFGENGKYSTFGNLMSRSHGYAQASRKRQLIRYLLENGGNINLQNDDGDTMLHQYCEDPDYFEFGSMIINLKNINFLIKNKNGKIPLEELMDYHIKNIDATRRYDPNPFINPNFLLKLILKTHLKNLTGIYKDIALCLLVIKHNDICIKTRYNWLSNQIIDELVSTYIQVPKLQTLCMRQFGYMTDYDEERYDFSSELFKLIDQVRDEVDGIIKDKKMHRMIEMILYKQPLND
ncbi:hypothetical protein Klosneuvirus_3_51 [Klosneuvirus KNV1]|uniref:Uncharacterized protein n=1 Tax=Klosneuvirus KNV1 TaxID=1977640 RepID=A0A1V0SJL6_9VIRU|nr:hypothetical protein Klosneuvirus_3_51 [Klosneuvirus KNV1]